MSAVNPYPLLYAAVQHHVLHYREDLTKHDLAQLERWPGVPFLHWTRSHGTWQTLLHPADSTGWPKAGETVPYLFGMATREHMAEQMVKGAKYCARSGETLATHYWNGRSLLHITAQRSVEIMEDHKRSLLHQWRLLERRQHP